MLSVKGIENSIQDPSPVHRKHDNILPRTHRSVMSLTWNVDRNEFCCSWRLNKAAAPDIARMSPQDLTHLFPLTFFGCSDEVLANTTRKEKRRK